VGARSKSSPRYRGCYAGDEEMQHRENASKVTDAETDGYGARRREGELRLLLESDIPS